MDGLVPKKKFTYRGLGIDSHLDVYDPAEDSFLLAEVIYGIVTKRMNVLEVGCGCGIVGLAAALQGADVVCIDINPYAAELTRHNSKMNHDILQGDISVIRADGILAIDIDEEFDIICFNPPYLPTQEDEQVPGWLNRAFDGGCDGLMTSRTIVRQCIPFLRSGARLFLLLSSLSPLEEFKVFLHDIQCLHKEISEMTLSDGEHIAVWRISCL